MFNSISIKANFTYTNRKVQFPNSLLSSIRPLPIDATEWSKTVFVDMRLLQRHFTLLKPQNRLLTFAIYGRDFRRDIDLLDNGMENLKPLKTVTIFCLYLYITFN